MKALIEQQQAFFILRAINLVSTGEFDELYVNVCRALGADERRNLGLRTTPPPLKPKTPAIILANMYPTVVIFISILVVITYFMFVVGG